MNQQLKHLEERLRKGAAILAEMESKGLDDSRYRRVLRQWVQLVAAYEFESEMADSATDMLPAAVGV